MPLRSKLLLIILDGLPWRNWAPFMGNLEGCVQSGEARKWRMRSVLPSTVLEHDPPAGSRVESGQVVNLVVSSRR